MNRILARILALLLSPVALWGQTAAIPSTAVSGTVSVPSQAITITTPKAGGKVTFIIPSYTASIVGKTAAATAPVSLSGVTGSFTCSISPTATIISNPDGTKTITGITCSMVTK